jgi:O-antigen/teichoic acid export membrane protein
MGLLRNAFHYLAGSVFAQVAGAARSFLLARIMVPAQYGLWVGATTFHGLSAIACLGTVETLLKEVPYHYGKTDRAAVEKVEQAVLLSVALGALLLIVIEAVAEVCFPWGGIAGEAVTSRLAVLASIASLFSAFYTHRCAAREDFRSVGLVEAARAVLGCIFALLLALPWKARGAVWGLVVAEAVLCVVTMRMSVRLHGRVGLHWVPVELWRVVKVGFPITVIWWVYMVHASVGRMAAGYFLGAAAVGLYGFAVSTAMVFAMVPNIIGRVTYPQVNKALGASRMGEQAEQVLLLPTRAIAMVWPCAQIMLWFLLPPAYLAFFPKYLASLETTRILIVGSFFSVLVRNGANFLVASNRQVLALGYVVVSILVNGAVTLAAIRVSPSIDGIALGSSLASAALAFLIWWGTLTLLGQTRGARLVAIAKLALPLGFVLLAVGLVEVVLRWTGIAAGWTFAVLGILLSQALYLICLGCVRTLREEATYMGNRVFRSLRSLFPNLARSQV